MKKIIRCLLLVLFTITDCVTVDTGQQKEVGPPQAPSLAGNWGGRPRLDTIVTNSRPFLSVVNGLGGQPPRTYTFQIDEVSTFDSPKLREYLEVPETPFVTGKRVKEKDTLDDKTQYYWRVRTVDARGNVSNWCTEVGGITARFYVDTTSDDEFLELMRIPIKKIVSSAGVGTENLIDYDDYRGPASYWQGFISQSDYWIKFDFREPKEVARIWQLMNKEDLDSRLKNYVWEYSTDDSHWAIIPETRAQDTNAYRRIIELKKPITARYFKLYITDWYGTVPKIHEIIFFTPESPPPLDVPDSDYVLIIRNGFDGSGGDGYINTIKSAGLALDYVSVPYWQMSLDILNKLDPKPVAILASGQGRAFGNLPMDLWNGLFEIIRNTTIPFWGTCAGMQLISLAYGATFVRPMGPSKMGGTAGGTYTRKSSDLGDTVPPIDIVKQDPIFAGVPNPFYTSEFHREGVVIIPEGYEILAISEPIETYGNQSKCPQVIKAKDRPLYGAQFHGEKEQPWNLGRLVLLNFLRMAMEMQPQVNITPDIKDIPSQ